MSKQNSKIMNNLSDARKDAEDMKEERHSLERKIKDLFTKIDNIQAKYELVCKDIISLKSVIESKDKEIQNKEDVIKEKDSIIKEKETVVSQLKEKIRKMTIVEGTDEFDEQDFCFDNLMTEYPIRKRQSEMPNIKSKLMQGRQDDKIYKVKEYEVSLDENSSEQNENLGSQFASPNLIRRGSVYNKLKNFADDPDKLKELVTGSPERKISDISSNDFTQRERSFSFQKEKDTKVLGPIHQHLIKSKHRNIIHEIDESNNSNNSDKSDDGAYLHPNSLK